MAVTYLQGQHKESSFPPFLHASSSPLISTQASHFASCLLFIHPTATQHQHSASSSEPLILCLAATSSCRQGPAIMHSAMSSRFAILSAIAAGALAAPTVTPPVQSTTDAVQSFLSVSNLDASQVWLSIIVLLPAWFNYLCSVGSTDRCHVFESHAFCHVAGLHAQGYHHVLTFRRI